MPKIIRYKKASRRRPSAHLFFFQLCDTTPELMNSFVDLCAKHLGGHPGQVHFSVGSRALDIDRDVSATDFSVSVHMIFEDSASFEAYSASPAQEAFTTQSAGMSISTIAYESYLYLSTASGGDSLAAPTSPARGPRGERSSRPAGQDPQHDL